MARKRCPICRSREWHKEPASGLITCSEGHVLQNYRNETNERSEFGPHQLRKRALKKDKDKDDRKGRANEALYHGPRARYFYFECLQLILRMQIKVLTQEWNLPPEFETICRDIWALHLSLLPRPPDPEPYFHKQERDENQEANVTSEKDPESGSSSDSGSDSDDDEGKRPEEDTLLADLLKEASESESSEDEKSQATPRKTKSARKPRNTYELPAGNIAVLMMACWTMRLPVMYKDFISLIEEYKLPYLEVVRLLPMEMKRHLARETISMLSPHFPPSVLSLHGLTSRLARLSWIRYGIHTPEVNAAPLLWRAVQAIGGQATLYALTKRLACELTLPLTLDPVLAPSLVQKRSKDPKRHQGDNVPAELALVGAVIAMLKLTYGLDGRERVTLMDGEPGRMLPGWPKYVEELAGRLNLDMRPIEQDMDEYLDFCQRALLGEEDNDKILAEFFPLTHEPASHSRTQENRYGIHLLSSRGSARIPAGQVRVYHTLDILGAVPAEFEAVLTVGSQFCGVDTDDVAAIVERYERRLVRRGERERRDG